MALDDHIDNMAGLYAGSVENFQRYLVSETMELLNRGYSSNQVANILNAIDMEDYILNTYGFSSEIDELMGMYQGLLTNLTGFGTITPETLQALTSMDRTAFMSNMVNTGNATRQALSRGIFFGTSEQDLVMQIVEGGTTALTYSQAETLANTMLNTYSRNITRVMANSMPDNTTYYYAGPVDQKTRPICLAMAGAGSLTMKEIDERYPGAMSDGGGWNCRHRWTMMTRKGQDKNNAQEYIDKLVAKGNYNPLTLLQQMENKV